MDVCELMKGLGAMLNNQPAHQIQLEGWVRNHRKQKSFGFIDFYDGTYHGTVQVVYDNELADFEEIRKIRVGASVEIEGTLVPLTEKKQGFEVKACRVTLLGQSPEDYPIQPKPHTREFLREQAYLRPRTNLFQAVFRVRNAAAMAIHTFLQDRGFLYINTPIFTDSDCEGAGEMFQATTLDLNNPPRTDSGEIDYSKDLFGKRVGLTVSGQFEGEAFAMAFKKIYTFGPTFRAENSNTKIHSCEFWQVEPEMAFCDLQGLMVLEEALLKYIIADVLKRCPEEMAFLEQFVCKGLIQRLEAMLTSQSVKITHREAIDLLQKSGKTWEFEPIQGEDIAKEHEKYLTDELFHGPVFITDWPKDIKCFYMKLNEDGQTVAAVDYIVPGSGELMGGSQREDNYEKLIQAMEARQMNAEEIQWYVNLRRFGSCEHSGFGLGFERLLIYLTGVDNIRDVIPFPRTPNNCLF